MPTALAAAAVAARELKPRLLLDEVPSVVPPPDRLRRCRRLDDSRCGIGAVDGAGGESLGNTKAPLAASSSSPWPALEAATSGDADGLAL